MADPTPILDRAVRATAAVFERAELFAAAMNDAGVSYALCGDVAAYAHVERAEPSATRFPKIVEAVLADGELGRDDFDRALSAVASVGLGLETDRGSWRLQLRPLPGESPPPNRGMIRVWVAGEPVGETTVPRVGESEVISSLRVLTLPALTRMLLGRWKWNDRVTLRDFMDEDVRLIDDSWPARYPEPLRSRMQAILDDPDG